MARPQLFANHEVYAALPSEVLLRDYCDLLSHLAGKPVKCSLHELRSVISDRNELLIFLVEDARLVGTAQGTLAHVIPHWKLYVNNVVVSESQAGRGNGRALLAYLECEVVKRWPERRPMKLELTNSPRRENGEFYEKLGFRARTEEIDDPTVVWVKELE